MQVVYVIHEDGKIKIPFSEDPVVPDTIGVYIR
jgi:hypothetical protein